MPTKKEKVYKKKRPSKVMIRKNNVVVKNPTSKSAWKSFERVVAKFFGTRRVPLSGSNSGHGTNSDSLHPKLYIECKLRNKIALWQLFKDTENKAKLEKKIPIVAIKQKGEKGYLIVMRPENLAEITEICRQYSPITESNNNVTTQANASKIRNKNVSFTNKNANKQ